MYRKIRGGLKAYGIALSFGRVTGILRRKKGNPELLNLGKNVLLNTCNFREHATVSLVGMPWIYPDHRHFGALYFELESAVEV